MNLFLLPGTQENVAATISQAVDAGTLGRFLSAPALRRLQDAAGGGGIHCWGTTSAAIFNALTPGDEVLISTAATRQFTHYARVIGKEINPPLGANLWKYVGKAPWDRVYFLADMHPVSIDKRELLTEVLGYDPKDELGGTRRVSDDHLTRLHARYGSVRRMLGLDEPQPAPERPASSEPEALPAARRSRVQGYEPDAAVRRAIEKLAMDAAEAHYRREGFEVHDTATTKPYDFRCTRNGLEVRVEVKGTRSDGAEVEVTIGEVENARGAGWRTDLFVLSRIEIARTADGPVARGGEPHCIPGWRPTDADLTAIRFRCAVPLVQEKP